MNEQDRYKTLENPPDYRIETLSITFSLHSEMAEANNNQLIEQFKDNFPEAELPEHFKQGFNISKALSVMCEEIEKLKKICN